MALNDRRSFLKMAALAGTFSTNSLFRQAHAVEWKAASDAISGLDEGQVAQNEDFWSMIQRAYSVSPQIVNLNNGGVSPAPIVVQQAVERYNRALKRKPRFPNLDGGGQFVQLQILGQMTRCSDIFQGS